MQIKSTKNLELVGRGNVKITPNDHIATGGEGSVYRVGNSSTVVKLFTDLAKMQRDRMPEKLTLLATIQHPYVVSPSGLVLDGGKPIGYYMPAADGSALSPVFTSSWRQREGFGDKESSILVHRMREAVQAAHDKHAVLVDGNELNWHVVLSKPNGPEPRVMDVDSWMIGRWPATVIMPSIRDWHAKKFDERSDWFSWGIVTFQIFSGLHPYKGGLDGYKPNEMERRMKENASVFSTGIRLNNAVRDFKCIPGPLFDWYVATFQQGERVMPPSPFDKGQSMAKVAQIARVLVTASGSLTYDKLYDGGNDMAVRVFGCGVVLLKSGNLFDLATKRMIGKVKSRECEVVNQSGGWLVVDWDNKNVEFLFIDSRNLKAEALVLQLKVKTVVRYEERIFVVTDQGLTEVLLKMFAKPIVASGNTWGAMVNSTKWYEGIGIQDAMGAMFAIIPFGDKSCAQVRVKELDGLRVVAAKAGNRFVTIITIDKKGQYKKLELTFDKEYKTYLVWSGNSDSPELNTAMLPKGVAAILKEDGELNIFVPTNGQLKKVSDKALSTTMTLGNWGNTVVYIHNGSVWSLKMS